MKKQIICTLPAALFLTLAACGSQPAEESVDSDATASTPTEAEETETATAEPAVDGKAAFAICATCHTVERGGPAKIGPNLHGVIDRPAASVAGFKYSDAMKGSGITWSEEEIDSYITNPLKKIPGNKMAAAGIPDAAKRAAIIAYIRDESSK